MSILPTAILLSLSLNTKISEQLIIIDDKPVTCYLCLQLCNSRVINNIVKATMVMCLNQNVQSFHYYLLTLIDVSNAQYFHHSPSIPTSWIPNASVDNDILNTQCPRPHHNNEDVLNAQRFHHTKPSLAQQNLQQPWSSTDQQTRFPPSIHFQRYYPHRPPKVPQTAWTAPIDHIISNFCCSIDLLCIETSIQFPVCRGVLRTCKTGTID